LAIVKGRALNQQTELGGANSTMGAWDPHHYLIKSSLNHLESSVFCWWNPACGCAGGGLHARAFIFVHPESDKYLGLDGL